MDAFNEELNRTSYQKKAVSKLAPNVVLDFAMNYFKGQGYRAGRTGRPNQVFIMGGAEGGLPRVTGEIAARPDVGKAGTTLVTMDAAGERLREVMAAFHRELRALGKAAPNPIASDDEATDE